MKGRHSASGLKPPRAPIRLVLAVLGACIAITAGTVTGLAAAGPGSPPRAGSTPVSTTGPPAAERLNVTAQASVPAPRPPGQQAPGQQAPGQQATPAVAGRRDPFGSAAASYLPRRAGPVLAAVYDLGTGRTWHLGQGQPQAEASIVKLDVLETLLAEQGQGDGLGLSASDRTRTEQMIEESDNDAATSLWSEAGGPARIGSFNARAGLTHTALSSCVTCPGFAWPGWGLTTTTPDDQIALLRQLVTPSSLLTRDQRDYALSLLEDVTPSQRWGVSGGVPAQVMVALKDGWLPLQGTGRDWQVNSVGWVSGGGRDYLIAVLTTGNPTAQYGVDTIESLAAMVWQHMG